LDFGVLQLYNWFATKTCLGHETGAGNDLGLIFGAPAQNGVAHLFGFDGKSWCLKTSRPDSLLYGFAMQFML